MRKDSNNSGVSVSRMANEIDISPIKGNGKDIGKVVVSGVDKVLNVSR